jgi:hypothetical protein
VKILTGHIACIRYIGDEALSQYEKYVAGGFSVVIVDASDKGATAMVIMANVAGRFELEFDSRAEAANFYLTAHIDGDHHSVREAA